MTARGGGGGQSHGPAGHSFANGNSRPELAPGSPASDARELTTTHWDLV